MPQGMTRQEVTRSVTPPFVKLMRTCLDMCARRVRPAKLVLRGMMLPWQILVVRPSQLATRPKRQKMRTLFLLGLFP